MPVGIALDSAGNVFITDYNSDCVQKFNKEGNFIKVLGSYGSCFNGLNDITTDACGNIYVIDNHSDFRNTVKKFDAGQNLLLEIGNNGIRNEEFVISRGIAVDVQGWNGGMMEE